MTYKKGPYSQDVIQNGEVMIIVQELAPNSQHYLINRTYGVDQPKEVLKAQGYAKRSGCFIPIKGSGRMLTRLTQHIPALTIDNYAEAEDAGATAEGYLMTNVEDVPFVAICFMFMDRHTPSDQYPIIVQPGVPHEIKDEGWLAIAHGVATIGKTDYEPMEIIKITKDGIGKTITNNGDEPVHIAYIGE